jgi:hypothetical protein
MPAWLNRAQSNPRPRPQPSVPPRRHPNMASDKEIQDRIIVILLDNYDWFYELAGARGPWEISHSGAVKNYEFEQFEVTTKWDLEDEGWWPEVSIKFRLNIELLQATLRSDQSGPDWSMTGTLWLRGLEDEMRGMDWGMNVFFNEDAIAAGGITAIPA